MNETVFSTPQHDELALPSYSFNSQIHTIPYDNHIRKSLLATVTAATSFASHFTKTKGSVRIKLHSPQQYYQQGHLISGELLFTPPSLSPTVHEVLKVKDITITLEGLEQTNLQENWNYTSVTKKPIVLGQFRPQQSEMHGLEVESPLTGESKGLVYCFPFTLQIDEYMDDRTCKHEHDEHLKIPPSIGCPTYLCSSELELPNRAGCIFYHLHAVVKTVKSSEDRPDVDLDSHPGLQVSSIMQLIRLRPNYVPTVNDFEKRTYEFEHVLKPSFSLSLFSKKQRPQLSVTGGGVSTHSSDLASSPALPTDVQTAHICIDPLLSTGLPIGELTNLPITITVPPTGRKLPRLTSVTPTLSVTTLCSTGESHYESPPMTITQKFKLTATNYSRKRRGDGSKSGSAGLESIPIRIPNDPKIVPSFQSCFMTRSYTMKLRLEFSDGSKSVAEMPVTLVGTEYNKHIDIAPPEYVQSAN